MTKKSKPFKKIAKWAGKKGYTVKSANSDYVDYDKKEIGLCENQNSLIYSFLHECGHVIIEKRDTYHIDFKSVHRAENIDGRHSRSNLYKYKKLREEMEAWEEGYKLAKKLKIRIKKDDYDVYAAKYFMTYVKDC